MPPVQLIVPFGMDLVPVLVSSTVAVSVVATPTAVDGVLGVIVVLVVLLLTVSVDVPRLVL